MMLDQNEKIWESISKLAIKLANEAGFILYENFRKPLSVEFKDKSGLDPVTNIDIQIQKHIRNSIKSHFPEHGFLGEEETSATSQNKNTSEYLWVVDPIDGTKNFVAGLPIYACSIGVLYKGIPYMGAIFLPWPNSTKGSVIHATKGSGAYFNDEKILLCENPQESKSSGLVTLPGSFTNIFNPSEILKNKIGDYRMTGSIAYEMAMSALGISQFMVSNAPSIWDIAAGTCIILESGGLVLEGVSERKRFRIFEEFKWKNLNSFNPNNESFEKVTASNLRKWQKPIIAGAPKIVNFTASNLRKR